MTASAKERGRHDLVAEGFLRPELSAISNQGTREQAGLPQDVGDGSLSTRLQPVSWQRVVVGTVKG